MIRSVFLCLSLVVLSQPSWAAPQSKAKRTTQTVASDTSASFAPTETRLTSSMAPTNPLDILGRMTITSSVIDSGFTGGDASKFENSTGFGAGILADIGHNHLVLETGLLYRQLGAKTKDKDIGLSISADYLAVPIVTKYYYGSLDGNSVYAKAGLMPALLMSKRFTTPTNASADKYPMNDLDLGAVIGVGGKVAINQKTAVIFEASYTGGLTKVFTPVTITENKQPKIDDPGIYNKAFAILGGLVFEM